MRNLLSFKKLMFLFVVMLFTTVGFGQTTLISPTGDGGFETGADFAANGWTVVNDATNKWFVGTVSTPFAGTNSAFISNDNGLTNTFTNSSTQVSYFYRDITVPAGETQITLSFKWKNTGETGSYDRIFVYTAPTTSTPVANSTTVTGSTDITGIVSYLVMQSSYQTATYILPASLAGTTFRLIFGWKNDSSGGANPPASVDNISLISSLPTPLMSVKGNSVVIADGDATPSITDNTDFGSVVEAGTVSKSITYTIANTGLAALNLTGTTPDYVTISGDADFTISTQPTTPVVATTGTTTFTVVFEPTTSGTRTAVISIANDDATVNPYNFTIKGTGAAAINGTYTIDNTQATGGTNFASFTDAIGALNIGISGPVTFNVAAGQTFAEKPAAIIATGTSTNTITFQKNGVGTNPKLTPTGTGSLDFGFCISGGDYITFDGIDVDGSAATTSTNATEFGYLIRNASATDGAQYNVIKNCSITLNKAYLSFTTGSGSCILSSVSSSQGGVTPTNATGANSYNKYYNLTLQNGQFGVYLIGNSSFYDLNCEVGVSGTDCQTTRNTITNMGGTSTFTSSYGIYTSAQSNLKIFNNDISNIRSNQATNAGILCATYAGISEIYNNKITDVANSGSTTTTGRSVGIEVQNSTGTPTIRVYNNFISNILSPFTGTATANRYAYGIYVNNTSTATIAEIDNNNVNMTATGTPTYSSTCFEIANGSTAVQKVRGNIFVNSFPAQGTTAKHYCWVSTSATAIGGTGSLSDYNDLFITNDAGVSGFIARGGTTANYSDLAAWKALSPARDANSLSIDPTFTSATDLHVSNDELSAVAGFTPQAWITTDIDCNDRNAYTPNDFGADAFGVDITAPTATFVPITSATNISVGDNVVITFSENVRKTDNSAIDGTIVSFKKVEGNVDVPFTVSYSNKVLTIDPDAVLIGSKDYTVTITGVEDISDNALTGSNSTTFTTGSTDITAPLYVSASIENLAPTIVVINFDENIQATSTAGITVKVDASDATISGFSVSTNTMSLTLSAAVLSHQVITVEYNATTGNVADVSANLLATFTAMTVTNNVVSSEKDITSFSIASPAATGVINGTNITLNVPSTTDVTALVPTIVVSDYATVSPLTGVAQDFTNPVTYTVTAEDLSTKVYTVTVNKVFSVPFEEYFEGAVFPPSYWKTTSTGAKNWVSTTAVAFEGTQSTMFDCYNANTSMVAKLSTPIITIPNNGSTILAKYFVNYYLVEGTYGNTAELYLDILNADGSVLNAGTVNLINGQHGQGWKENTLNLTSYAGSDIKLSFRAISDFGSYRIAVDALSIYIQLANDASALSIENNAVIQGNEITPVVVVKNEGTSDITNMDVRLDISGPDSYIYTETVTVATLVSSTTFSPVFADVTLPITGEYTATVTTLLGTDENIANDFQNATYTILDPENLAYGYVIYPNIAPVYYDLNYPEILVPIADHSSDIYDVRGGEWVNNTWYAYDKTTTVNRFITIDPITGDKTELNSTGITYAPNDVTYDYTTNTLFGVVSFSGGTFGFYSINMSDGVLTQIGTSSTGAPITLACNLEGQLYSVFTDGKLYTIDKTTGVPTEVGTTGITGITYVQSMAFDHRYGDVLYWNQQGDGAYSGGFYTINTTTGAATLVGQLTSNAEVVAFAIPYTHTYTVTYDANNSNAIGTAPVDANEYTQGEEVTVLSQGTLAVANYSFDGWNTQADGLGTTYQASETFTMGNTDVTLYAIWNPTYTATYDANNVNATGSAPIDANEYLEGDEVTVLGEATLAVANYTFEGWNTLADASGTTYQENETFVMGNSDVTLYAVWVAIPTHTVIFNVQGLNGTLSATVNENTITSPTDVQEGNDVDFTANPDANYRVKEWKLNDVIVDGNISNNFTLSNLQNDATVTVEFEQIPANTSIVNFSVVNGNGTINATVNSVAITNGASVANGSNINFNATPANGYKIKEWTLNGSIVNGNSMTYDVTNLQAEVTVTVEFEVIIGIEETISNVRVYPNPTSGLFVVETANANQIVVFDATGRIVYNENITDSEVQIDLSNEANGLYFIKLVENGNVIIKKLIKN